MQTEQTKSIVDEMFSDGGTIQLWKGVDGYSARAGFLDRKCTIATTHGATIRDCLVNLARAWADIERKKS